LRYSDIKIGHIYYADLRPVRDFEFGDNHLCIVLEKCSDSRSVIVVSLTSKSSGLGSNKEKILVSGLPKRLTQDKDGNPVDTYVVFDQVRTVVSNRLQYVYDGKNPDGTNKIIELPVDTEIFSYIVSKLAELKIKCLTKSEQTKYHKEKLFDLVLDDMLENIFSVIKGKNAVDDIRENVSKSHKLLCTINPNFLIDNHVILEKQEEVREVLEKISQKSLVP